MDVKATRSEHQDQVRELHHLHDCLDTLSIGNLLCPRNWHARRSFDDLHTKDLDTCCAPHRLLDLRINNSVGVLNNMCCSSAVSAPVLSVALVLVVNVALAHVCDVALDFVLVFELTLCRSPIELSPSLARRPRVGLALKTSLFGASVNSCTIYGSHSTKNMSCSS